MPPRLFNSPEKKWVREHLWLPALRKLKERIVGDIKYLTFSGPEGHDIELFCSKHKLIKIENVRVWERSEKSATLLSKKYSAALQIKQGEAFDLCRSNDERRLFPYELINLDFTSGAFYLQKPRWITQKFETIENVVGNQKDCASSFFLFFAVAASTDVDNEMGKIFLQKTAFDLATRLGRPQPLFNLTRNLPKVYPRTLAEVVPCILIRIGGEQNFDTECIGKALYRPMRSRKTIILSFTFSLTYDHPPLSQTFHQAITHMDEIIEKRQQESFSVSLIDVNQKVRSRRRR